MTANAFMSVSLEPPLVLISVDRRTKMCGLLHEGSTYGVSVLCESQSALSDRFAGRPGSERRRAAVRPHPRHAARRGRARGLRLEGRALLLGRRPLAVPRPRRVRAHGRGRATAVPRRPLRAARVGQRRLSAVAADGATLDWDGCFNVRDLGGLRAADGTRHRRGALVRADALERLTAAGWRALEATACARWSTCATTTRARPTPPRGRRGRDAAPRRWTASRTASSGTAGATARCSRTPLYYRPHLDRFPGRRAAVTPRSPTRRRAGSPFHCSGGRDRTGMVTLLLLALAGVGPEDIAADYALSRDRQPALFAARGVPDAARPSRRTCAARARRPRRRSSLCCATSTSRPACAAAGLADARRRRAPRPDRSSRARDWLTAPMATATATLLDAQREPPPRADVRRARRARVVDGGRAAARPAVDTATQVAVRAAFAGVPCSLGRVAERGRVVEACRSVGRRRDRLRGVRSRRVRLVHRRAQPHDGRSRPVHPGDGARARRAAGVDRCSASR